ncbi:MAG: hypothetical protein Q8Q62_14075 [Mesorhizobium sp.]|nr:hypothetical protein [Mesorhizobium sp.]
MQGFGDFDFLVGEWRITNEYLTERLKGAGDWEIFAATSTVQKVMPLHGTQPGTPLPPATLRRSSTFDPAAGTIDSIREPVTHGGNLEQMFVPARGFTGMTLRLYDPATELWSIYWSDTKTHRLFPPTIGRFANGRGTFFGDDVEGGQPVKVRFDWTAGASPVWEQSMSADGGETWEKNWVMRFER